MTDPYVFMSLNDRIRRIVREELSRFDANGLTAEDYPRLSRDLEEGRASSIDFSEDLLLAIARRGVPTSGQQGPDAR